ncbi:MAG TPA: putative nucleotidyltransferase substrate binding domain-containing protein, partial [Blastocatellia bacterium]|nr:putative nucleotidyltransferase substrate binding domain-containing protein [Blastocatellia bacterium]
VWLNQAVQLNESSSRLISCSPELPAIDVAKLLVQSGGRPVAVVANNGHPLGLITNEQYVSQMAAGNISAETPAQILMNRDFQTARPGLSTPNYWLKMLNGRCASLVITANGWAESQIQQVITDSDLAVNSGRNPVLLMREMLAAETVAELAYLFQRANAFLLDGLVGPSVVEWFSQMFAEFNAVLIERLVHISETEMLSAGRVRPELPSCWLFFGRAGRRESLTRMAPEIGLVYDDPPREIAEEAKAYFSTLFSKVSAKLRACGLQLQSNSTESNSNSACKTLSEWKSFYADLICDPIGNAIYRAREYFDVQDVCGNQSLALELKNSILAELEQAEAFIPVLANDTLSNLPPLTFYQDSIIESDGTLTQTLDVEHTALNPIVDAARVFALAGREIKTSNTLERLSRSANSARQHASILNDAAEAWRIIAYHHAVAGLSTGNNNAIIQPNRLSRVEQRLLKSAFDSTRRFVELISATYS